MVIPMSETEAKVTATTTALSRLLAYLFSNLTRHKDIKIYFGIYTMIICRITIYR